MSKNERLYHESVDHDLAVWFAKRKKAAEQRCPTCGSDEVESNRIPFERTAIICTCLKCGKSWELS